jgi:hypothetical protein
VAVYWSTAVMAPWITLFAVYGFSDGWSLIGLYSHLFVFPLLFGWVQLIFLLRVIDVLLEMRAKKTLCRIGLGLSLVATLVGGYIQGAERPALFELKPDCLHERIPNTDEISFIEHLKHPDPANRIEFEKNLPSNSWQILASDRSSAELVCGLSILLQIFVWSWTALAFGWAARMAAEGGSEYHQKRKRLFPAMLWTLILSLPWFAMRKVFEIYRGEAYVNLQIPNVVVFVGLLFVLGSVFLAAVTWQVVGDRLNSAVGLVSTLGISGLCWKDDWLREVFPRTPSVSQFLLMLLIVGFMLTVLLVKIPDE